MGRFVWRRSEYLLLSRISRCSITTAAGSELPRTYSFTETSACSAIATTLGPAGRRMRTASPCGSARTRLIPGTGRDAEPKLEAVASRVITHTLGSRNHVRFLKAIRLRQGLLSTRADLDKTGKTLGKRCESRVGEGQVREAMRGCHATAVDPKTKAFAEIGIDCYTCHGVVDLEHTNDTSKIFLSKKRRSDAVAITNTCAQCHLRGGNRIDRPAGPAYYTAGDDLLGLRGRLSKADDPS